MGFFKKLAAVFGAPPRARVLELYIRCGQCKTSFKVRVDLVRDIIPTFEDSGAAFELRKEAMDNKCFRMIHLNLTFDNHKNELSREIDGGEYMEKEEYDREHERA